MLLTEQKEFLLSSEPVARLTGDEFSKIEGITLKEQIIVFFNESSSNPVRYGLQATNQGVFSEGNTANGSITKVLQKIISTKSD